MTEKPEEQSPRLKIVALEAENIKRLSAVAIRPDGNLVEITGKNGAGKTSVLDAIWWALSGEANIQTNPIRKGYEKAVIRLDLGDVLVTRKFSRKEGGGHTTQLVVENSEGARYQSPQALLNGLIGKMAFDPLEFSRMKPREQFDTLKSLVPNVDFDADEKASAADFAARTVLNREAEQAAVKARAITIPPETPDEEIDTAAMTAELADVSRFNAKIAEEQFARKSTREKAEADRGEASVKRRQAEELLSTAAALEEQAAAAVAELDARPALPDPKDADALAERLRKATETNRLVQRKQEKVALDRAAKQASAKATALTTRMEDRERAKKAAIAEAKLPVEGLTLGASTVYLRDVPFDQASDAEQLRASIAIAAAMNPRLRVIRVRDGSLLDEDGMKALAAFADEHDMQVWVERVDSSGVVGFVIEDGHLKGMEPEPAEDADLEDRLNPAKGT